MAKVKMNVSADDLKSSGRKSFEPGTYHFEIKQADMSTQVSTDSGTKWLDGDDADGIDPERIIVQKIELEFASSSHPDSSASFKVFDQMWLTEKAKWKYVQVLKAIGMDPAAEFDTDELEGKEGAFYLSFKKKKDKDRREGEPEREAFLTPARFLTAEESDQWAKDLPPLINEPDTDDVPF